MYKPWVLPSNTKLVGEGQYTILNAKFTSGDMIDMGSSACTSGQCSGISIEHLRLDALSQQLNGIVNSYAGESSYVNDVILANIGLTGLKISASNSGPYSNINFSAASLSPCSGGLSNSYPACVDIEAQTRGVHGVTCIGAHGVSENVTGDAAVYVNASNNTVVNVHIEGFFDGIEVGDTPSTSNVANVVLSNVLGGTSGAGPVTNVVHICGPNSGPLGKCNTNGTVTDVTIFHATDFNDGGGGTLATDSTSIQHDVTGTTMNPIQGGTTESTVAVYILGETVGGGHSRFTTNPGANFTNTLGSPVPT